MRPNLAINAGGTLLGFLLCGTLLLGVPAGAQEASLAIGEGGVSFSGRIVQLFLLITVLSLAPGILVMATSFIRLVVVFSLLRSAIGLQQAPPNMVLVSLALFLTAFIMAPTFEKAWYEGVSPMIEEEIDEGEGLARAALPFREFMARQTDPQDLAFFDGLAARQAAQTSAMRRGPEDNFTIAPEEMILAPQADLLTPQKALPPLRVLLPAFMISELSRAFEIGFLVMMPFLVIDLAVAAILMSMGMMMLPPQTVSLSMKLIFFVLIDGWRLLSESLVQSFF